MLSPTRDRTDLAPACRVCGVSICDCGDAVYLGIIPVSRKGKPGGASPSPATGQPITNTPTASNSFDRDGGANEPDAPCVNSGRQGVADTPLNLASVTPPPAHAPVVIGARGTCGGVRPCDGPAAFFDPFHQLEVANA